MVLLLTLCATMYHHEFESQTPLIDIELSNAMGKSIDGRRSQPRIRPFFPLASNSAVLSWMN